MKSICIFIDPRTSECNYRKNCGHPWEGGLKNSEERAIENAQKIAICARGPVAYEARAINFLSRVPFKEVSAEKQ